MTRIAEYIERQAGHITIGIILMLLGAALWAAGVPKAEDVLPYALGVIARSMVADERADREVR